MQPSDNMLEKIAPYAIEHMNEDHQDNLLDYAHALAGCGWAEAAVMTTIDVQGFVLLVRGAGQEETVRITFDAPLTSANQLRPELVRLAKQARTMLNKDG